MYKIKYMKEMLSKAVKHLIENKLPKTFLVNIKKSQKVFKKKIDHIGTKTSLRMLRRNRRDTSEPKGNLFKVGFNVWT